MAVINQINLVNNVGESETFDIETKITDTVRQYIHDQTELSDMEEVTLSANENDPTICEYDGFLLLSAYVISNNGTTSRYLYKNNVQIPVLSVSQYAVSRTSPYLIPIKKGDSLYMSTSALQNKAWFMYYKKRYYAS